MGQMGDSSSNSEQLDIYLSTVVFKTSMLTRSKIKMEESIHRVEEQLPYFNQHSARHQNTTVQRYRTEVPEANNPHSPYRSHRNQVIKELRQEYEILRNLHVDQNVPGKGERLSEGSAVSSSARSKQSQSGLRSPKVGSRELEAIHLEKKQLEIVIGNSMRKIEELLNNQIALKKTIHELRGQVQGRGGVNAEYQKNIKAHQRREEDLQGELSTLQRECEKVVHKNKELSERIRSLEERLQVAEREKNEARLEQDKWHDLIRNEKDKVLNKEIEVKSIRVEAELAVKEKEVEIVQLKRQLQVAETEGIGRQGAATIRRLEEDLREKDNRIRQLVQQRDRRKSEVVQVLPTPSSKNYLQELMYKSREMNEQSNKALTDSVNMVMVRMAELQKRNDDTLKRQIEQLRKRTEEIKRTSSNEESLLVKIGDLERVIQRETAEKGRLSGELKALREHRRELQERVKTEQKRVRELEEKRDDLADEVRQLEQYRSKHNELLALNSSLEGEVESYVQKVNDYQARIVELKTLNRPQHPPPSPVYSRGRQEELEREVLALKREVDEANFRVEQVNKEAQFQANLLKSEQASLIEQKRLEIERLKAKLSENEAALSLLRSSSQDQLRDKEKELIELRHSFQSIRTQHEQQLLRQKKYFEDRTGGVDSKHSAEVAHLNQRVLEVAGSNEKLMKQLVAYNGMESEVNELRRALRHSRNINSTVDHLWEVKETEYGNVSDILRDLH